MRRLMTFDTGNTMYHLGITKAHPNVLTGGSPGRMRAVTEFLDDVEIEENPDRGLVTAHGIYQGVPISAFSTGMGTGSVSCTFPEILEMIDEDEVNVVRIGTSGALQPTLAVGDVVVGDGIVYSDGTTPNVRAIARDIVNQYVQGKKPSSRLTPVFDRIRTLYETPLQLEDAEAGHFNLDSTGYHPFQNPSIVDALANSAHNNRLPSQQILVGPTQVTSEIYGNNLVAPHQQHTALAVSMEISALCALSDFYNLFDGRDIRTGNLLMISDSSVGEVDNMQDFLDHKSDFEEMHIRSGLDALVNLHSASY